MRGNLSDHYTPAEGLTALSRAAATYYTASVNHKDGQCADYIVSCGTYATSFVATLQHSADDSSFTDEADTTAGNDVSLTLTAAGFGVIECPQPRRQYTRLKVIIGGTCVFGVVNVPGPLRHKAV